MIFWKDFDFSKYKPRILKRRKGQERHYYSDDILTFDIETSSYWIIDGTPVAYSHDYSEEFLNECDKGAITYIWQFGINDMVIYGRELEEFKEFLLLLKEWYLSNNTNFKDKKKEENVEIYIYVHNLGYEFQFLTNILDIDYTFASAPRKPYYFTSGIFTFRCSYMLTGLSLAAWGESIGVSKQVGLLDYNQLRTPLSPMTDDELKYCEYDILVMYEGLKKYATKYKNVRDIPMTATGETRLVLRHLFKGDKHYHSLITRCIPRNADELKRQMLCFSGGLTHTIYTNANKLIYDVGSNDMTSAYPDKLLSQKYPCEEFQQLFFYDHSKYDPKTYGYIFCVELTNVINCTTLTYIPKHKLLTYANIKEDNGKILSADKLVIYINEVDLDIITKLYNFDINFLYVWRSRKAYLPYKFRKFILEMYRNKTELKGTTEGNPIKQELLQKSKAALNALYGISVTNPCKNNIVYMDNEWIQEEEFTDENIDAILQRLQDRPGGNIVAYPMGVWCTAYTRQELVEMYLLINEYDSTSKTCRYDDVIYMDTDSVKYKNVYRHIHKIEERNSYIRQSRLESIIGSDIIPEELEPCNIKGEHFFIGLWDNEGLPEEAGEDYGIAYREFKALGAKRYAYRDTEGKLHITVSGVSKKAVVCLNDDINNFDNNLVFDRALNEKKLSIYLDGNNAQCNIDGYKVKHKNGINMRPCNFTMSITDEYWALINDLEMRGKL